MPSRHDGREYPDYVQREGEPLLELTPRKLRCSLHPHARCLQMVINPEENVRDGESAEDFRRRMKELNPPHLHFLESNPQRAVMCEGNYELRE